MLNGDGDNDTLNVSGNGVIASGGSGNDTFNVSGTAPTLDGGVDDDTLVMTAYADLSAGTITGIEHLRLLQQNEGNRVTLSAAQVNGFADVGTNHVSQTIGLGVATSGTIGANFAATLGGYLSLANGDNTVGLSHTSGSWSVDGNNGIDVISTGSGNDQLNGGNGNDTLNGGSGNDILNGGADVDTLNGGGGHRHAERWGGRYAQRRR